MRSLTLFGSLPGLINENTAPWDWLGQLRLSIDPGLIRFVDVFGSGADYFDAALNRQWGTIVITPFARADFEAFTRIGQSPELSFGLRFFMADGSVVEGSQSFTVRVLNLDDTPPQALRLDVGGAVPTGVAGARIGTLAVSDPDTATGFSFMVREDDRWLFEVVGNTLRLKPGMMLSDLDGPVRAVTLDVSDGQQSSAFTVTFNVTDPRAPAGQFANLLLPGQAKAGFHWSGNGVLMGDVMSSDVAAIRDHGSLLNIVLDTGESLWVNQPRVLDLVDGRVLYDADSRAARIWNVYETGVNRAPTLNEMQVIHDMMDSWLTPQALTRMMIDAGGLRSISNEAFLRKLYENALGFVDPQSLAGHLAALQAGRPREDVFTDFLDWRRSVGHEAQRAENGLFVPRANAKQVDILLEIGLGTPSGPLTRGWTDYINSGGATLDTLARAVEATFPFRDGIGSRDVWNFTWEFYVNSLGKPMDMGDMSHWAIGFATGAISKSSYMKAVADSAGTAAFATSHVNHRPEGPAFDVPWF